MSRRPSGTSPQPAPENRRIASADGVSIAFDLYPSSSGTIGIVLLPGFWRSRHHGTLQRVARSLADRFGPCAVMDLRGHGESAGTFEFNRFEHLDAAAVAREVAGLGAVDGIVLFGFSAGGAIAISCACRNREIPTRGLVLVSPVSEFQRVVPRPNPFTLHRHLSLDQALAPPRFRWPGRARLSALEDATSVDAPIALIHARNDWLVSHTHSEALARRAPHAVAHILDVPGRYHADRLFDVAGELVWPIVDRFLARIAAR